VRGGAANGGGPEDPMLEQRVGRLEEKVDRIEAVVTRIDGMVTRILETGAKQSADILEIKATGAKQADLNKVQLDIAEMKGRLSGIEGRIGSVEGRFNQVPTIWGMLGIVATLLIGIAGLMFTAGKLFHP
jgi:hypothetical protein